MSRDAATGEEGTCMFVHMKKEEIFGLWLSFWCKSLSLHIAFVLSAALDKVTIISPGYMFMGYSPHFLPLFTWKTNSDNG